MSVVMQISDHVVVLEYGRKISDGDPDHVKNDPRVIAAYLGVDDEEVGDVLIEVGDDQVLQQLEGGPDMLHGPHSSSSMMAGSVMDTIDHSDPSGERVTLLARHAGKPDRARSANSVRRNRGPKSCGQAGKDTGRSRQSLPTASGCSSNGRRSRWLGAGKDRCKIAPQGNGRGPDHKRP